MNPNPKSRGWTFTLFLTKPELSLGIISAGVESIECEWIVMQSEVSPTTKKIHLQGAIWFKTPRTLGGTKRRFPTNTVHLEKARGSAKENLLYCTKTESRLKGSAFYAFEKGTLPVQGARTDVNIVLAFARIHTVQQCWSEFPEFMFRNFRSVESFKMSTVPKQLSRPEVTVYYGKTGTGKSHACFMKASGSTTAGEMGPKNYFSMLTPSKATAIPWIDGYEGQEDVVIEDFSGEIGYRILLRMLDQYPNKMQIKGGMVEFCPKRIWISSNKHPKDWYPTKGYEGGPLQRRLEKDSTGKIKKLKKVWINGIAAIMN